MDWLVFVVHDCGALMVSSDIYKSRRFGNQVLLAQRYHNDCGCFLKLSEFGKVRRGFIIVLEGAK